MSRPQVLSREEIARLYARPFGSQFEIAAERSSGERVSLVRPLVSVDQARFVEQQLTEL